MKAVTFGKCFGWLHDAPGVTKTTGSTGVVLCNPFGHEALWAHRGWRKLAEHLSHANMPTLRFDYAGTGDSAGNEEDGEAVSVWLHSIEDAVAYLRDTTGVRRIVLCGVRLGATLAALAAERLATINAGVDALVMLAPVISGKDYLRELSLIQRRWRNSSVTHMAPLPAPPGVTETFGFRMYPDTVAQVKAIELSRDISASVPKVLVLDPASHPRLLEVLTAYRDGGVDVDLQRFDEYAWLMSETGTSNVPQRTYEQVSAWLIEHIRDAEPEAMSEVMSEAIPEATTPKATFAAGAFTDDVLAAAVSHEQAAVGNRHASQDNAEDAVLVDDGYVEIPVTFGGGHLFGIYCQPADQAGNARSAVSPHAALFVNTAGNHHIGDARMWVLLARRLARLGIPSLRMDVAALGDSKHAKPTSPLASLHDEAGHHDTSAGIDWLVARGHSRPLGIGVCSGAYLHLQAALLNEHVAGLVLVNQHCFIWSESMNAPVDGPRIEPTRVYMQSLRRADKWGRLLRGEIEAAAIVRGLMKRRAQQWKLKLARLTSTLLGRHSTSGTIRAMIRGLQERHVPITFVYGEFDAGLEEAQLHFGRNLQWLRRWPGIAVSTDRSLDHALFLYPAREMVMRAVEDYVKARLQEVDAGMAAKQDSATPGVVRGSQRQPQSRPHSPHTPQAPRAKSRGFSVARLLWRRMPARRHSPAGTQRQEFSRASGGSKANL